jgi:hypothetical protein
MIRRPNSTGRIPNGKFEKVRGVGTTWKNGAQQLFRRKVVDVSQNKECAERNFVLFAFQVVQPPSRNAISLIAPFLGKAHTLLFNVT